MNINVDLILKEVKSGYECGSGSDLSWFVFVKSCDALRCVAMRCHVTGYKV